MMMPVTRSGKPASGARRPRSDPWRALPDISREMLTMTAQTPKIAAITATIPEQMKLSPMPYRGARIQPENAGFRRHPGRVGAGSAT